MRNKREHIRRAAALLLAVAGLIICAAPSWTSSGLAYAQATTPSWSYTGSLNTPRSAHTATLLPDGKVLVAGGFINCTAAGCSSTNTAELYDPATGLWSVTDALDTQRQRHTATLLQDGKVLVAGGCPDTTCDEILPNAELYDPNTGAWNATGSANASRGSHTATLLPDGRVLVAGGLQFENLETNELYNPATASWSITGGLTRRISHTATLLPDGKVLVAGGAFYDGAPNILGSTEIYDPATGSWSSTASLNEPRFFHTATLLQNGKVLVVGGEYENRYPHPPTVLRSAELYDSGGISTINSIDDPQFFVRQHSRDFLAREPEQEGLAAWLRVLADCPAGDAECFHQARLTTSAAFFGSPEFQLKGYYVFRFYKVAFNRLPEYTEIVADMSAVTGQTPAEVYARKSAFANSFAQRQEFVNQFGALSNAEFVNTLLARYQQTAITTPDPFHPDEPANMTFSSADLIAHLDTGALTRAQVLRAIADSAQVNTQEFNRAFVAMQYYGYLRRTPEAAVYQAWLAYLNAHPQDFREMVRGFVDSIEYRLRLGRP